MSKILFLFFISLCLSVRGQIIKDIEIDKYQGSELIYKKSKIDYVQSALKLKELYNLDKNDAITRTIIVDSVDKSKNETYVEINNWFIHSFNDGKSVIQLNDKDAGSVIGKGYISDISYNIVDGTTVNAWIILRVDIKNNKFRITTTIQEYEAVIGEEFFKWLPKECYPFKEGSFKKTTAKAFVNSHIWSQIIINKLKEAVINGITDNNEEW
ncbi:DUF4468 domain-containing protein [Bacteroides fragilis]|uniref:DUF4468 domain-containing protein n=1 Tax=Bacteroides fragilis TaxID=817 RepID=UPI001879FB86|nr:DUF4468 domain-containing protein [Bacteroides fragilis]MBE7400675.1 DUF4468 domain-containing protein [Bacteroides fragilis]